MSIVCGAPNVAAVRRCCDPAGAKLPSGHVIGAIVLQGVPSQGMICSGGAGGSGDDAGGIMVLPSTCRGEPPTKACPSKM